MIGFGIFLAACGLAGWAAAGFTAKARTAILSGSMSGLLMVVAGLLAASNHLALRKIGTIAGTVLSMLFAAVFAWRASVAWADTLQGGPKLYVALLLSVMALAALVSFFVLLRSRESEVRTVESQR
jgi:predicted neutral ceramidase superfamily lipid hydrolase